MCLLFISYIHSALYTAYIIHIRGRYELTKTCFLICIIHIVHTYMYGISYGDTI